MEVLFGKKTQGTQGILFIVEVPSPIQRVGGELKNAAHCK